MKLLAEYREIAEGLKCQVKECGFHFKDTEKMLTIFEERLKKIWTVLCVDDSGRQFQWKGQEGGWEASFILQIRMFEDYINSPETFGLYKLFLFIHTFNIYTYI